ncbi:hypothetical protein INT45_003404 [Circinella minor]|uniref:RGS domain-containing protein n=1 Tax=Circinella minor TaxID=1195481 RepID=A0A8H7S307_9FUNG|nr:hypothetical protein INT45_003404 [Circinella minor]
MTTKRRPSHINLSAANAAANMDSSSLLAPRTPKSISKSRRSSIAQESGISFNNNNNNSNSSNSRPSSRRSSLANIYSTASNTNNTNNLPQQHNNESDTSISSTTTGQLTPSLLSESTTAGYFSQDLRHSSDSMEMEHHPHSNDSAAIAAAAAVAAAADAAAEAMAALPPNFDVHMSYKIKTTKSSKKLDYFFGEQAPHDICIQEIRKEGLKALLQSKIPLCYFLYHLLEEFSCENLFFFIELEQYESFTYTSEAQQFATAQHIHNTYLTDNSHFEVNLDDKVRRQVTSALHEKKVKRLFDNAKRAVYSLLESSFMRFCQTETFTQMVMDCGELTTHYGASTRHDAVRQLLSYIERQHKLIYGSLRGEGVGTTNFASTSQTSRRRHELVKSMIHEFCRSMLGVEVEAVPYKI